MEAVVFVGLLLGSLGSGRLYLVTSPAVIFGISTISALVALLYMYIFLDESVKNLTGITSSWVRTKYLFLFQMFGMKCCSNVPPFQKQYYSRENSRHFSKSGMLVT